MKDAIGTISSNGPMLLCSLFLVDCCTQFKELGSLFRMRILIRNTERFDLQKEGSLRGTGAPLYFKSLELEKIDQNRFATLL